MTQEEVNQINAHNDQLAKSLADAQFSLDDDQLSLRERNHNLYKLRLVNLEQTFEELREGEDKRYQSYLMKSRREYDIAVEKLTRDYYAGMGKANGRA